MQILEHHQDGLAAGEIHQLPQHRREGLLLLPPLAEPQRRIKVSPAMTSNRPTVPSHAAMRRREQRFELFHPRTGRVVARETSGAFELAMNGQSALS